MKPFKPFKYLDINNIYKGILGENTPDKIIDKVKPFIKKKAAIIIEEVKIAREKLKDIPGTNYNLGMYHMKQGVIDDAIFRFKIVNYLAPNMAEAYYNLGRCLIIKGDLAKAEENLRKAVSLKAGFPEVNYILDKIKSPESVDTIPDNIIAEHLEWRGEADTKSSDSRDQRDKTIITGVLANISDKNPNLEVLDLGSATGGRGKLLRAKEVVKRIVGVDIYSKATAKATKEFFAGEPVYNSISNDEISKYLVKNQEKFDVILAGNIFSYMGNLEGMFKNIARALKPNGILAIIIDKNYTDERYKLDIAKDSFTHSFEYIEEILKICGFSTVDKKDKDINNRKFNVIITKLS